MAKTSLSKPPPNIPQGKVGERIRLRANSNRSGTITEVTPLKWCSINWDDGHRAPKICHQYELVALPIDGSAETGV